MEKVKNVNLDTKVDCEALSSDKSVLEHILESILDGAICFNPGGSITIDGVVIPSSLPMSYGKYAFNYTDEYANDDHLISMDISDHRLTFVDDGISVTIDNIDANLPTSLLLEEMILPVFVSVGVLVIGMDHPPYHGLRVSLKDVDKMSPGPITMIYPTKEDIFDITREGGLAGDTSCRCILDFDESSSKACVFQLMGGHLDRSRLLITHTINTDFPPKKEDTNYEQ